MGGTGDRDPQSVGPVDVGLGVEAREAKVTDSSSKSKSSEGTRLGWGEVEGLGVGV